MTTTTEPLGVPQVFLAHHCHIFLLKIAIRWAAFKIGSLEAVAALLFKDPALDVVEVSQIKNGGTLKNEMSLFLKTENRKWNEYQEGKQAKQICQGYMELWIDQRKEGVLSRVLLSDH